MKKTKRFSEEQYESLYFYTRSDFILMNNLLWGNDDNLERAIEVLYNEHKAMMHEALEIGPEKRFGVSKAEAEKIMEAYKRRTPEEFDDQTRKLMIDIARKDIKSIYTAMRPAEKEMLVYRNIRIHDALSDYNTGDSIELKGLTSTSAIIHDDESFGKEFVRYHIMVKKETPLIILENDSRNEQEILLMPMKYIIKCVHEGNTDYCKKTIELVSAI